MTASDASIRPRPCHWDYIDGPRRNGVAARFRVWVCEQPYRTVRPEGPDPDCPGCRWAVGEPAESRRTA